MNHIDPIRDRFQRYQPKIIGAGDWRQAAVALTLRHNDGYIEALLIERAHHKDDPWSGHMAFPGGGVEQQDADPRAAAERETLEEVGIELEGAEWLGRLDDQRGRAQGANLDLVISAFVYFLSESIETSLNHEVRAALWVPLNTMLDPTRHVRQRFSAHGDDLYPGIRVSHSENHVVWGLTHRFLDMFFEVVGQPLPKV